MIERGSFVRLAATKEIAIVLSPMPGEKILVVDGNHRQFVVDPKICTCTEVTANVSLVELSP